MKLKAKQKLKDSSFSKLQTELSNAQAELVNLKLKIAVGKEKNLHSAKLKRHEIAIIKTILSEKHQAEVALENSKHKSKNNLGETL